MIGSSFLSKDRTRSGWCGCARGTREPCRGSGVTPRPKQTDGSARNATHGGGGALCTTGGNPQSDDRGAGGHPGGLQVLLDTSVLIAHLGGTEPVATAATDLIERCLRTRRNEGVISTITLAELLTRPFRAGQQEVDVTLQRSSRSLPDLLIRSVDFLIAAEAAPRIRADTGLDMPDASVRRPRSSRRHVSWRPTTATSPMRQGPLRPTWMCWSSPTSLPDPASSGPSSRA